MEEVQAINASREFPFFVYENLEDWDKIQHNPLINLV